MNFNFLFWIFTWIFVLILLVRFLDLRSTKKILENENSGKVSKCIKNGDIFYTKILAFLHQNLCIFCTKIFHFLHQNFCIFTPRFVHFFHQNFCIFTPRFVHFLHQNFCIFTPNVGFLHNFWNFRKINLKIKEKKSKPKVLDNFDNWF